MLAYSLIGIAALLYACAACDAFLALREHDRQREEARLIRIRMGAWSRG